MCWFGWATKFFSHWPVQVTIPKEKLNGVWKTMATLKNTLSCTGVHFLFFLELVFSSFSVTSANPLPWKFLFYLLFLKKASFIKQKEIPDFVQIKFEDLFYILCFCLFAFSQPRGICLTSPAQNLLCPLTSIFGGNQVSIISVFLTAFVRRKIIFLLQYADA